MYKIVYIGTAQQRQRGTARMSDRRQMYALACGLHYRGMRRKGTKDERHTKQGTCTLWLALLHQGSAAWFWGVIKT